MQGTGMQVVHVEDHSYRLDEKELNKILLRDDVKDLPVVVVSVAGAFRGGKSFVLNFFLRYLTAPQSSRDDGSWIGDDNTPLEGFSWRGGSKRHTTGIVIWSVPIITTFGVGGKVAVVLMDTQGTFDSSSTVRDCSTIFALSTLLSSIQIYNVSKNIGEDHLQHLQLFTEYGKLIRDQSGKAFQVLEFLVRDWQNASEFPFGSSGGNLYLEEKLKTDPKQAKELRDLREHIRDSFTSVSCFLLPHPGVEVFEADFNGRNNEISVKFKTYIKELTAYLFGPGRLKPKEINGQTVTASELVTYFKSYMTIFNSDEIPTPKSILQATAEAGLLSAFDEARRVYERNMEADCGTGKPSLPAHDLKELHERHIANAVTAFSNKKIMGEKNDVNKCRKKLNEDLESRLPQFVDMNIGKAQRVINAAKEAYEAKIGLIRAEQLLCVHPLDLEQVHREALQAAIKMFDKNRKSFSKKEDKERTAFLKSFEKQYELLFRINEQNNKMAVTELRLEYWQTMEKKCSGESPLSESEFLEEHNRARQEALDGFAKKRNHPDFYDEDSYKSNLMENITEIFRKLQTTLIEKRRQRYYESSSTSSTSESGSSSYSNNSSHSSSSESSVIKDYFNQMKAINKSKNKSALQAGIRAYDEHMSSAWDSKEVCLHPGDLDDEHIEGERRALTAFRPNRVSSGRAYFDSNDEDEKTLSEIINDRLYEIEKDNDSANETAVQAAYNEYVSHMDYNCGFSMWWILLVPYLVNASKRDDYHKESKNKAHTAFYKKRRDSDNSSTDRFFDKLESKISAARKKY